MDDIDVHDFMATHKPRGKSPKLDRYTDAIFYLKEHGFSDDDVLLFLSEKKGLVVGKRTLSRFLARDKDKKTKTKPSAPVQSAQPVQQQSSTVQPQIGKFDAREKINVDEWK